MDGRPLRIMVCGLGWSGSGTVVDLLKEYEGVIQVPGGREHIAPAGYLKLGEFSDFRRVVGDQLMKGRPDREVPELKPLLEEKRRKVLSRYLETMQQAIRTHPSKVVKNLRIARQTARMHRCTEKLAKALEGIDDLQGRVDLARKWMDCTVDAISDANTRAVLFDQPINFGQHDDVWPEVFEPFKLIVVHRDPRDQFADRLKGKKLARYNHDVGFLYGWNLEDRVRFDIDLAMGRAKAMDETLSRLRDDQAMLISFEEMVLDYEASRRRVQEFVGFKDEDHVRPREHFDPEWSRRNIGIHEHTEAHIAEGMLDGLMQWYQERLN